jgi:TPP-dependent 2-oxoacid decarboxylase
LKGSDEEIAEAYEGVDTDGSGVIDIEEFKTAIKGERMVELNLRNVLGKMGVQLNNMGGQYEAFKATEQRRRLMKKEYEEKLATKTKEMIQRLSGLAGEDIVIADPEGEKL